MCQEAKSDDSPPAGSPSRLWRHVVARLIQIRLSLGYSIVYSDVAFFLDPRNRQELHAAMPLRENNPILIAPMFSQAQGVLRDLLDEYPQLGRSIAGRTLVVRFVDSHHDLDYEVAQRVEIGKLDRFGGIV